MKVGIDVTNFFSGLTNGTPIYLYNLVRALPEVAEELEIELLYAHRRNRASDEILEDLVSDRVHVRRTSFGRDRIPPGGWWLPVHPPLRRLLPDIDVFHAGDFVWPRPDGMPVVGSVLDLTTQMFPHYHVWANRWRDGKKLRWLRRAATRVLTISESTRRDYIRLTGSDPALVDVAPLARGRDTAVPSGNPTPRLRERYSWAVHPYILSVGTVEPRKNHLRLIRAFESLVQDTDADVQLVLAGGPGWKMEEVSRALAASPARERIHTLGFVSEAELADLYAGAQVFAYPSLYEGFGLPVLEAMFAGIPVLTSNVSSLPEVAGTAAVLVDPLSVDQIHNGLARLLRDGELRTQMIERGFRRAREFTWRRTAELTLESYRKACRPAGRQAEGALIC